MMENMYLDSREEAADIARKALPFTSEHGLPANPINYAIFYNYYAGKNSALKQATDKLLESGEQIQQIQLVEIYQNYLSNNDGKLLVGIRKDLHKILSTAVDSVAHIDSGSNEYQVYLKNMINGLSHDVDVTDVKNIIENITSETHQLIAKNRKMQIRLRNVTVELGNLRMDFQQAQNDALLDPLTNIDNRRAFDINLQQQSENASIDIPLCLLMIDIDYFKKINDTVGHLMGDEVLKVVAQTLKENVRGQDIVARYGGEEFAILLPETSLEGGVKVAQKIRKKISGLILKKRVDKEVISNITVSIGLAQNNGDLEKDKFVSIADKNLYIAKENGRNQVCSYSQ